MLNRPKLLERLRAGLKDSPAVALIGPRQCGKTTLARQLAGASKSTYFDLENPVDLARLSEPMTALEQLRGLIVIDEVQRHPDLFPILRALLDRKPIERVSSFWEAHHPSYYAKVPKLWRAGLPLSRWPASRLKISVARIPTDCG